MSMARLISRVVMGVFSLAIALYVIRIIISWPLGLFNSSLAYSVKNIIGLTLVFTVIFFIWSVLYFVYNYFERYNKSLKLEASVKEIELNNLKAQLKPHFIFNALNSIRALIDENPEKSKKAVNQLSNILRSSLATGKKGLTPFEDELKIVKDYIGLEQIRFEERLKAEFEIDDESLDFLVPPLMVQTLVENGIKHGVSKLTQGGSILLKTSVENDRLKIQVRNSGVYINGERRSSGGLGLDNTTQRLKLIYGDNATFKILTEKNNFVLVEIEIPHIY
jgi:LytS/YehU family sensor histidine kinase